MRGYNDMGKFRLLTWNSFNGQFFHAVEREGKRGWMWGVVKLARCEVHLIRELENLV